MKKKDFKASESILNADQFASFMPTLFLALTPKKRLETKKEKGKNTAQI